MGDLRIKQIKSIIGHRAYQESNLRSLGLRKIGQEVVRPDSATVRGMIDKVRHLVEVEEVNP
jgi:large subunit ribosomal protein L30